MATKIVTKNSSTASAVPTAAQLVQGELAVNVADKRLFTEDNGGSIVELGTNPSSLTVSGNIDVDGVTNLDAVDIDGAVDMASTLTVTGEITANGGIALGDNDKATFGASDDLQIYHDGSNSYISDTSGTGDLYLRGSNLRLTDNDGTLFLFGAANADTRLYYSGSSKLATSSTGIDVTGSVTADGLTVDGVAKVLGTAGNTLIIADATETNGYQLKANTSATADFGFLIETLAGKDLLKIEPNNDISFFEDTGTTPKFFWNASAESLGIGTSSPASTLEIAKNDQTNGATLSITNTYNAGDYNAGDVVGTINFRTDDVSTTQPIRGQIKVFDDTSVSTTYPAYNAMSFSTGLNNTLNERMRIDSSGHAIIPAGVTLGTATGVYNAANTLDDYEEGTWAPTAQLYSGTMTVNSATYTKIGNLVTLRASVSFDATADGSGVSLQSLPFAHTGTDKGNGGFVTTATVTTASRMKAAGSGTFNLVADDDSNVTYTTMASTTLGFCISYTTTP